MILAVAKNYKMTYKFDIDDVVNTSKMSDMPKNIFNDSNVSKGLYISSFKTIKVFNLPWPILGGSGVPRKPPSTHIFNILKNEVRNQKSS